MTPGEQKSSAVPQSQNLDSPVFAGLRAGQLALCAGGLFLLASVGVYMQVSAPYQWHERRPWFSFAWFLQPVEWNIDSSLPRIQGNINTLAYSADQRCIWIAGDAGLLAVSGDGGRTWLWKLCSAKRHEVDYDQSPHHSSVSIKLKLLLCLPNTGVNTPGTMFPNS